MNVIATDLSQNSAFEFSQTLMVHGIPQLSAIGGIGAFFLIWFLAWIPIAIPLSRYLKWQPFQPLTPAQKLPLLGSLYAIAPLLLWGFAVVEGNLFTQYGLDWQLSIVQSACVGIGIGLLELLMLFGIQQWQGWSYWQSTAVPQLKAAILPGLLLGLWISATEELVFRGFLLNHWSIVLPVWGAAIVTSLMFAGLHLVWEQHQTLPQLPGLWLMGMVLVLARWADQGMLGLAIGLHAGWVAGMISLDSAQVMQYRDHAPVWFTGIHRQPLAGLGGILLLLLTGGVLYGIGSG